MNFDYLVAFCCVHLCHFILAYTRNIHKGSVILSFFSLSKGTHCLRSLKIIYFSMLSSPFISRF
jgi:hypothetical protein